MIMKSSCFLLLSLLFASSIASTQAALATKYLAANGLNFTCTVLSHKSEDPEAPLKEIMLLHGFPMFRVWWMPLLQHWDDLLEGGANVSTVAVDRGNALALTPAVSVHAVACDLRGYSPGASPDNIEEYDYSIFAQDTFELAKAAGFDQGFHLLGHDHGAGLAWYVAGNDPTNQVLSLTTMSVPHIGLMSDALCGDNTDEEQVVASNYFNQFSLSDSAFQNNASLTSLFQSFGLDFLEAPQFQKMLWWYNGSLAKHFAMPRVISDVEVEAYEATNGPQAAAFMKAARTAIPMEERPCIPIEGDNKIGSIEIPTLFICGLEDSALLCNNSFATDFPSEILPDYEHVNYQCGHDFFLEGNCNSMEESRAVMDKITAFVLGDQTGETGVPATTDSTPSEESTSSQPPAETEDTSSSTTTEDVEESPSSQVEKTEDTSTATEDASASEMEDSEEGPTSSANRILEIARKLPMLVASAVMASSSLCW